MTKFKRVLDNIFTAFVVVLILFTISTTILGIGALLLYLVQTYVPILTYPLVVIYILAFFTAIYYPKVASQW